MIRSYADKNKNKFIENKKSISLHKINPYYENKSHYLPYKYIDPSFKSKYKGPLMQKDLYILNLFNKRINKKNILFNNNKLKNKTQLLSKLTPNIAVTSELVLNNAEIEKKKVKQDYSNYITNIIKKKFFTFNPIKSKNKLIQYREYINKNIPTYKGKPRKLKSHYYLDAFQQKMRDQAYKSWKILEDKYIQRENSEDKYLKTDYNNFFFIANTFSRNNPNLTQKNFSIPIKKNKKIYL